MLYQWILNQPLSRTSDILLVLLYTLYPDWIPVLGLNSSTVYSYKAMRSEVPKIQSPTWEAHRDILSVQRRSPRTTDI